MRNVHRSVLHGALSAAAVVAFLFPRILDAEDEVRPLRTFLGGSLQTALAAGAVGAGEVIRDSHTKSGWAVQVRLGNPTPFATEARATVVVLRGMFAPDGRCGGTAVEDWSTVVSARLAPHETVTRVLGLPSRVGAELDAFDTAPRVETAAVEGPATVPLGGAPRPMFVVELR